MKVGIQIRILPSVSAVLLTVLLGAQAVQAAHLHVDHPGTADCLQCQMDTGQAALPTTGQLPAANRAVGVNLLPMAPAPVVSHYDLAARGPPARSC